jgi:hypothetical protein
MTTDSAAHRGVRNVRVLLGTERFSSQHSWSELDGETIRAGPGSIPGTGETRPVRHSPEAPSASSGLAQSGHSWPGASTRSRSG